MFGYKKIYFFFTSFVTCCVCSCAMKDLELIAICCLPLSWHLVPPLTYPRSAVSMATEAEEEDFNKYEDVASLNERQEFGVEKNGSVGQKD